MIKTVNSKTGFLRAAFVAGVGCASLLSANLYAQAPATEATAERIIVTGSNIPTAEEVLASPLDTVTSRDISETGGTSDILTILSKRNADFVGAGNLGGSNANTASGATQGGSIISLRGLPTLVLFEGRRIVDSAAISAGGFQFSDVSIFPTSLISRIEVLKDGASALYGSEAVGGVVNIFLKKDFNGVQIDARYGFTPSSGVSERRVSAIAGLGNDTTHVTVGFQYYEIDPLFNRERGYSQPFINVTTTYAGGGRDSLGAVTYAQDPNAAPGVGIPSFPTSYYILKPGFNSPFDAGVLPGSIPPPPAVPANAPVGTVLNNPGQYPAAYDNVPLGQVLSFDLSKLPTSTLDIANTNAYASVEHQIFGKQLEIFSNFLFAKNHNQLFLNGQPLNNTTGVIILGSQKVNVNYDPTMPVSPTNMPLIPEDRGAPAAFNPFQLSIDGNTASGDFRLFANQRFQNKPRTFTDDSSFYRILAGVRSQIAKDWTVEAAAYYSNDTIDFVNAGLVNATQLNAAIAGTAVDFSGNPIPPLDYFARNVVGTGPGQITGSQFNTLFGSNIRSQSSYQEVFDAKVTGFPLHLPGGDLGVSFGGEYRLEGFKLQDSPEIFVGSVPVQDINVGRAVKSVYAEVSIPVIGPQMKIPFAYSLDLDLAGRFDHYDGVKEDAKVPKVTLRYQPIKDLTLRATYSNSFVAPTLYQLVGPSATGFSTTITLNGQVQDQAMVQTGSNPNLVPSTAESYTAGMVYSPSFIPGLTVTADYFRTLQQQIAGVLGGSLILSSVEALGPGSPYANLVAFNNFPGRIGSRPVTAPGQLDGNLASVFYNDTLVNIGATHIEGFDFTANYDLDLHRYGQAQLGINAVMFTLAEFKTTPQSDYYNINGLDFPEGGGANPNYRITALARYSYEGASAAINMNYIPGLDNAVGHDPDGEDQFSFMKIGDYLTFDMRLQYEFRAKPEAAAPSYSQDAKDAKGMVAGASSVAAPEKTIQPFSRLVDGLTVAVGCNNLFDRVPPTIDGANNNTDLTAYDPYGRFLYFEVSKKF